MSRYSKAQEDRMEGKLKEIGFICVEDTARRKKHAGDRIMRKGGKVLTIDHKSTRGKKSIRVEKEWLEKIKKEAIGGSIPVITFSFKDSQKMYAIFDLEDMGGIFSDI